MLRTRAFVLLCLTATTGALAQSSASYRMEENSFNNGGRPLDGATAASASYTVSLDALGDSVAGGRLAGRGHTIAGGFGGAHAPTGEVQKLVFLDQVTLAWHAEPSAWTYNLYRGAIADLAAGSYGGCHDGAIAGTTTTDTDIVAIGDGFFYHVSAVNGLAEEGTLGFASSGIERVPDLVCP